jgi:hypothetical protein
MGSTLKAFEFQIEVLQLAQIYLSFKGEAQIFVLRRRVTDEKLFFAGQPFGPAVFHLVC